MPGVWSGDYFRFGSDAAASTKFALSPVILVCQTTR